MTILHCIPGMGGGGAERQLALLAGPLAKHGWNVHVALTTGGPNLRRLEESGATVHMLRRSGNHDLRLAWELSRVFKRVQPDLAQVWFVQMEVLAGAVAELRRVPWILSERSCSLAYPRTLKNIARVLMGRTADAVVSNSAAGDQYWERRVNGRVRRFVIPNAVPLDEADAAAVRMPVELGVSDDDDVVLFAGRFGPEKNVEVLVAAVREIVRRPRTTAILCGTGPLRGDVQSTIAREGLGSRILTPGYVDDLWPFLKRASVMLSIGLFEGRPNVVLEAMTAKCPLVVSDIPAHREILDDQSAVFVDPGDGRGVALATRGILDDRHAASMRATRARSRVEEWSTAAVAAAYDRAYRAVLAGAASGAQR